MLRRYEEGKISSNFENMKSDNESVRNVNVALSRFDNFEILYHTVMYT